MALPPINIVTFLIGSSAKNRNLTIQEMDNNLLNLKSAILTVDNNVTNVINVDIANERLARETSIAAETTLRQSADAFLDSRLVTVETTYLKRDGTTSLLGNFNANSFLIRNLSTPLLPGDAVNKDYVDSNAKEISNFEIITANQTLTNTDFPANNRRLFIVPTSGVSANIAVVLPSPTSVPEGTTIIVHNRNTTRTVSVSSAVNTIRTSSGSVSNSDTLLCNHKKKFIRTSDGFWEVFQYVHFPHTSNRWNTGLLNITASGSTFAGKSIALSPISSGTEAAKTFTLNVDNPPGFNKFQIIGNYTKSTVHSSTDIKGMLDITGETGHVYVQGDDVPGFQTFTLASINQPIDSNYPVGSNQREYLIIGRTHDNGGARIRSYFKGSANGVGSGGFGITGTPPGLVLEAIINDNGQLDQEPGAVAINAAGLLSGNFVTKNNNDNILTVSNHTDNLFTIKGDGKIIANKTPEITQDNQLTTKAYVDTVAQVRINTYGSTLSGSYIYPPSGYTINDLRGIIVSPRNVYFNGDVNYDDTLSCYYDIQTASGRIAVYCFNSEQRATGWVNYFAIWRK